MQKNSIQAAVSALMLLGSIACPVVAAPAEIYLVRHAEKLKSADKDPALSPCGVEQARAMAKLIPASLSMIYHSGYQRTQQTAQQIAMTQNKAALKAYNPAQLPTLANEIKQQNAVVLIVGHSNTTPELIHLLSQLPPPHITEQDYGVLYQLKRSDQGYQLSSFAIQQPTICSSSST